LWLGSKRWIPFPLGESIAWPWYSLIGSAITFGIGSLLSLRNPLASARAARGAAGSSRRRDPRDGGDRGLRDRRPSPPRPPLRRSVPDHPGARQLRARARDGRAP